MSNPRLTAQRTAELPQPPTPSVRPRRRPWALVAALLSMVVAAGSFAVIYLRSDAREPVLAVVRTVQAGQELTAADLRVVHVVPDAGIDVIPAGDVSRVIGHTAAVPLTSGTLLAGTQIGPAAWPPADQVVVAVPVKTGRLADGIVAGVRVLLIPVAAADAATGAGQATAGQATATGQPPATGTVVSTTRSTDGSGTTVVSLLLPRADAVAVAGTSGDLSLALIRG